MHFILMLPCHRKVTSTQESECKITHVVKVCQCKLTLSSISYSPLHLKSLQNHVKICVRSYSKLLGLGTLNLFYSLGVAHLM